MLQAEKVLSLPLDLRLTNDYRYALEGVADVNGRECFVLRFDPVPVARAGGMVLAGGCARIAVVVLSGDPVTRFTERDCAGGTLGLVPAHALMPVVMANALRFTKYGA